MNVAKMLFSGNPGPGDHGKLSNEAELAEACPEEFKKGNRWTEIVDTCYVNGSRRARLRWKSNDMVLREKQWDCFRALLATLRLTHEDKIAVGGWMLSECMLEIDANAS